MKCGFVTCVQLGLSCMEEIYAVGGHLDLVITLPDEVAPKKSGRIYVDTFCAEHDIEVLKIRNVNDPESTEAVRGRGLDWLFIIGWSQIARSAVLTAPRRGVLGIHPTLLPMGRGRAAVPWAILKGLPETGVTLFQLDEGVDTGPILAQHRLSIAPDETATTLYQRIINAHREVIAEVWPALIEDRIFPIPQNSAAASQWPGRTPADGQIAPDMTVEQADRLVRATTRPYPGAFWIEDGQTFRIWRGQVAKPDTEPNPRAKRLVLSDGAFDALDFDTEPQS